MFSTQALGYYSYVGTNTVLTQKDTFFNRGIRTMHVPQHQFQILVEVGIERIENTDVIV